MESRTNEESEIESAIESYRKSTSKKRFMLKPEEVPQLIRTFLDMFYPDEETDEWLRTKNKVYGGKTGLEIFSELDPKKLKGYIHKFHDGVYKVLAFTTVPEVIPVERFYSAVREAQYKQLKKINLI